MGFVPTRELVYATEFGLRIILFDEFFLDLEIDEDFFVTLETDIGVAVGVVDVERGGEIDVGTHPRLVVPGE
jgi:hypothetical protein